MDVCESCLEFSKRTLSFGFGTMTGCQGLFQPREVTPKLKLRQYLPAKSPERIQLLRTQLPRYTVLRRQEPTAERRSYELRILAGSPCIGAFYILLDSCTILGAQSASPAR